MAVGGDASHSWGDRALLRRRGLSIAITQRVRCGRLVERSTERMSSTPIGRSPPARHPPRLRGSVAMRNALPRLAHGRSRLCHPGPARRRLRAVRSSPGQCRGGMASGGRARRAPQGPILVQSRRNKYTAKKFFRELLKGVRYVPRTIITDKLKSYGAAKREILPGVEHRQRRYLNNRCENSHRPTRQRAYRMQGLKSAGHAQRFLSAYGPIAQHFRPRRHLLSALAYRDRDEKPLRALGPNHGHRASGVRAELVGCQAEKCLLLPGDDISPNKLTMPPVAIECVRNIRREALASFWEACHVAKQNVTKPDHIWFLELHRAISVGALDAGVETDKNRYGGR